MLKGKCFLTVSPKEVGLFSVIQSPCPECQLVKARTGKISFLRILCCAVAPDNHLSGLQSRLVWCVTIIRCFAADQCLAYHVQVVEELETSNVVDVKIRFYPVCIKLCLVSILERLPPLTEKLESLF